MKSITLTALLLVANSCKAQFSDWWKDYRYGMHSAYSWQGNSSVEVGAYRMCKSNPPYERRTTNWNYEEERPMINWHPIGFWSSGASVEVLLDNYALLLGPKLFSELNMSFVSFSLGTTSYTNFTRVDLRLTPGIGISFYGTFGVRYERNIVLGKTIFDSIQPNRITVFVNIIKDDFPGY